MDSLYKTNPTYTLPTAGKLTNRRMSHLLSLMLFLACMMSGKAQEINLESNSQNITSGDVTPSTTDNTDFGVTDVIGKTLTYTIQNTGAGNLTLTGTAPNYVTLSGSSNFSVTGQPSSNIIATGGAVTFTVKFLPTGANALKTATVSISNDDSDENPYTFAIQGYKINAIPDTKRGNMMDFDGLNDVVACGDVLGFQYTAVFSCEAWVKTTFSAGYPQICSKINPAPAYKGWGWQTENGQVQVYFIDDYPISTHYITGNDNVADGKWHHVAFSHLGSGNVNIYVDGVLQTNTLINTGVVSDMTNTANFNIGSYDTPLIGELWQGNIDEVRIWNTARTQTQIRENMHLTLSGVESGLVAYYQFNETEGVAIDAVSGFHGTLLNGASRIESSLSVGKGLSKIVSIPVSTAGAEVALATTQMEIDFNTTVPAGELVITQIVSETPYQNTNASPNTTSCYWVVRNFGTNITSLNFNSLTFQIPAHNLITNTDETTPANLKLYKRGTNLGGGWTNEGSAFSASNTTKQIVFNTLAMDSFSEFIIGSPSSPLPITLVNFNGERIEKAGEKTEEVKLTWATASEVSNKGFEIQVFDNAQTFKTIAFIEGRGNSTSVSSYRLAVSNPNDGYYRLKQLDFDGKFSYSPIVFVEGIEFLKVYPNPNNGTFKVVCGTQTTADKLDLPARLLNAQGIEVWRGTQTEVKTNLPAGVYFLHTTVAGKAKITKVVIQ